MRFSVVACIDGVFIARFIVAHVSSWLLFKIRLLSTEKGETMEIIEKAIRDLTVDDLYTLAYRYENKKFIGLVEKVVAELANSTGTYRIYN